MDNKNVSSEDWSDITIENMVNGINLVFNIWGESMDKLVFKPYGFPINVMAYHDQKEIFLDMALSRAGGIGGLAQKLKENYPEFAKQEAAERLVSCCFLKSAKNYQNQYRSI